MNTKIIKLDLNRRLYDKIIAKQGDTKSRFLLFQLLDGSIPFYLTNRSVRAYMIKPDGKEIFNDLIINNYSLGYCTLELTNQVLAVAGTVKIELMVTEEDRKLTSYVFELEVIKSINSEKSIVSTNEFTALLNGLSSLSEYDNYKNEIAAARDGEVNLLTKVKKIDEQLDTIANYQEQEDFVDSLSKQMVIKQMSILCNDVDSLNYSIFYDIENGKGTGYWIDKQLNDDYSILKGGRCGTLSTILITTTSKQQNRKTGNFTENYPPNGYTTEIGSKLYFDNITGADGVDFYSYVDNRGGIWKLYVEGQPSKSAIISTYSTQSEFRIGEGIRDLDPSVSYNIIAEFMGADPNNAPVGGTARGWYVTEHIQGKVDYNTLLIKKKVLNLSDTKIPLQPQSNKDFAFLLKKKGASYTPQFFPLHSGVKTSYKVKDMEIWVDGVEVFKTLKKGEALIFKDKVVVIQKVYCKIPDDINTTLGVMTSKYIFNNKGTVELLNSFKALEDIEIIDGYVNMFPVDNTYCNVLKTSLMNKYSLLKSSGSTNLVENDRCISYIAGGVLDDLCVAMTTINPLSTMRKGKNGRRNPLIWIEHRSSTFQKLYPHVFRNALLKANDVYNFGCKFIVCVASDLNSLYMDS